MSTRSFFGRPLIAALAGAATVALPAGALYLYGATSPHAEEVVTASTPARTPGASSTATPVNIGLPDFSGLVQQYGPAVVNVSVKGNVKTSARMPALPGFDDDDPFLQFFRGFQGRGHPSVPVQGEGSGFIVSPDGVILTNAHVVADAQKVTVRLTDRREFEAKVLGQDEASDVAVLKIDADRLPVVRFGDPARMKVGEWVVAIGAPFGFENSVTAGIVSAIGRNLPDDSYVPFIQTDVAINPGNSGGPLFNLNGEVIGMNSQIYSRSGGYQGVSFAIPIDVAMNVSHQLRTAGHVTRGRLGVGIQDVNQALAESFGLDKPRGALVGNVEKGGPAEKAGLKAGDVILAFNSQPVGSAGDLPAMVARATPGQTAEVEVWRDGSKRSVRVELGEMNEGSVVAANRGDSESGRLGLQVRPLSPDERREADLSSGLVVEDVEGAAADAGIRPGDVVLSANGAPTRTVADLRKVVTAAKNHVALLVQRGDTRIFVPVELG